MANFRTRKAYWLTPLTNLHAGTGDTTYGVIDKEIQRDSKEGIPVIHSSGIKGSFRELFEEQIKAGKEVTEYIFGSDQQTRAGNNQTNFKPGNYHFHEARLLTLPVRSNIFPFFNGTSSFMIKAFIQDLKSFLGEEQSRSICTALAPLTELKVSSGSPIYFDWSLEPSSRQQKPTYLEGWKALPYEETLDGLSKSQFDAIVPLLGGENLAIFSHEDFKQICRDLPVIARNNLENGVSKNLWYEEIVPRQSRFYGFIGEPAKPNHNFFTHLEDARNLVQIGGNATIGYGLCHIDSF